MQDRFRVSFWMPREIRVFAVLYLLTLTPACSAQAQKRQVTVAAAANLNEVFQVVGREFEKATGVHPTFSFASTAQLALQIEHSAPFDVYAAADVEHVIALEKKGLLATGSRAIYATGVLALWVPPGSVAAIDGPEDLRKPAVLKEMPASPRGGFWAKCWTIRTWKIATGSVLDILIGRAAAGKSQG